MRRLLWTSSERAGGTQPYSRTRGEGESGAPSGGLEGDDGGSGRRFSGFGFCCPIGGRDVRRFARRSVAGGWKSASRSNAPIATRLVDPEEEVGSVLSGYAAGR